MKTRHQVAAYIGLLGMTTLIAILISIRDRLIAIGPWVLGVLLAVIGLVMVYLLHKLYVSFRKNHMAMQAQQEELEAQRQARRIASERWEVERQAMLLNQHHQSTRIYADQRGYMPMLVNITELGERQYVNLPHPAHMGRLSSKRTEDLEIAEQAESLHTQSALPVNVRYDEIAGQIPRGHSVLGISENGLETCEFKDLMTMLICGGSSTGKTNTVAIKLHEAITIGRNTRMVVIDPHKNKPDSLYNKIRQYETRFLMPVAQTDDEIVQALTWFKREFQQRMEMNTQELENVADILLVCDEVFSLCYHREDERIVKLLKVVSGIAGYESRGYGMFAWFLTQKVTGLKWLRDAVMTTICHKMQTMAERVLASNDDRKVARDMDNWTMRGRIVVFGLNLPVTVAQMPLFTAPVVNAGRGSGAVYAERDTDEMEELQPSPVFRPAAPIRNDETASVSSSETNGEANRDAGKIIAFRVSGTEPQPSMQKETSGVSEETKKTIQRMHRAGMPMRDIARLVGLSGEKYGLFKLACQELGIQPSQVVEG